jgi:ubiquitin-protein ligase
MEHLIMSNHNSNNVQPNPVVADKHHRVLQKNLELLMGEDGIENSTGGKVRMLSEYPLESAPPLPLKLQFAMDGPDGSPYSGGAFRVEIRLPKGYPFVPPTVWFLTKIWHPNVEADYGMVFLDFLTEGKWSPAWNLKSILLAVFAALSDPLTDDNKYANEDATFDYIRDLSRYSETAQLETDKNACGDDAEEKLEKVLKLKTMGFDTVLVRSTLEKNGWDVELSARQLRRKKKGSVFGLFRRMLKPFGRRGPVTRG